MSTTAVKNLTIEAGTTYRRVLRFYTDAARTVKMDLTGYQLAAQIRAGSFAIPFAFDMTNAEDGEADMILAPEATRDVQPGTYKWDMLAVAPESGRVSKYTKGTVVISETQTILPADE